MSYYSDVNSTFLFNSAFEGGAIYSEKSTVVLSGTKFESNYANEAGALFIQSETNLDNSTNLNFTKNYGANHAGALKVISSSKINLVDSIFLENYSAETSGMYLLGTEKENIIQRITFQNNNASTGNTLSVMFSSGTIKNVTFLDNNSSGGTTGIYVTFSTVSVDATTFDNSAYGGFSTIKEAARYYEITGGAIMINIESVVTISNTRITNCYGRNGGGIYLSGSSSISASNLIISECYASVSGGGLYLQDYNSVDIYSTDFSLNGAGSEGNDIYSSSGTLRLNFSNFEVLQYMSSVYVTNQHFYVNFTNFTTTNTENSLVYNNAGGGIISQN